MAPIIKDKKETSDGEKSKAKKNRKHPLNTYLGGGILRYSRSKMYKRRALYRLKGKKHPVVKKVKKPIMKKKPIGGQNNGGERVVYLKKPKSNYPTKRKVLKRPSKSTFNHHKRYIRKTLTPGRILILLAGRHQGKRVVLLKTLDTGLLVVTGPFVLNGCPLRRISQRYVIATKTKIDLGKYEVPPHVNDKYFSRKDKKKTTKRAEGDIFATKKEKFVPNEQRKDDQKKIDDEILKVIKGHPEAKFLTKYLKSMFSLHSTQYPHRMDF